MSTAVAELARIIKTLQDERQKHVAAIAEIDSTFSSLGITPAPAKRRGRKPGSVNVKTAAAAAPAAAAPKSGKKKRTRTKAKDGLTGEQFIYKVLAEGQLLTADVNKKWVASGRNGRADILLGQMVAAGKLKRQKVKDERGSRYSVA